MLSMESQLAEVEISQKKLEDNLSLYLLSNGFNN